ncbi:MAG: hypothetical protein FWE21_09880 [Defluviitaleaceae bacterium]|nr:hypothetical protein [Defluviitaleaceae bacterium]
MISPITQSFTQPPLTTRKIEQANTHTPAEANEDREKTMLERMQELHEQQEMHRENMRRLQEDAKNAREAAKAQAEYWRNQRIAMEIATRIMRGDNVPQEDKDFLLEHNPAMFKLAMSVRQQNEDAENHERLSPERESDCPSYGINMNPASVRRAMASEAVQAAMPQISTPAVSQPQA